MICHGTLLNELTEYFDTTISIFYPDKLELLALADIKHTFAYHNLFNKLNS